MRPLTILIADDNPRIRAMLREIIGARAGRVVECADGVEAVFAYSSVSPDVVLMDVSMPRLDGIGAMARIRADGGGSRELRCEGRPQPRARRSGRDRRSLTVRAAAWPRPMRAGAGAGRAVHRRRHSTKKNRAPV